MSEEPLTIAQVLYPHLRINEKPIGKGPQGTAPTSIAGGIYPHLKKPDPPAPPKGTHIEQLNTYYSEWLNK